MTRDDGYESSRLLRALTIAGLVLTGLLCVYGVASGLFFDKEKLARFLLGAGYLWCLF